MYSGAFTAYLGDRIPQLYTGSMRVTEPSRFYVLDADVFGQVMRDWFPMAVHLLEGLFFGNRNTQLVIGERERLLALGSLSAGLTHELNNPASAAVRATVGAARADRRAAPEAAADRRRARLARSSWTPWSRCRPRPWSGWPRRPR